MLSLVSNAHMLEVILTLASDVNACGEDPLTQLDSHTNVVVL